ncbi:MAG TPA: hypothetical protein VNV42_15500 [Solirubrobacteraceae bacterium]|jgi:hypothetical protein|nr:hypothetical protein [Solirubrobacteraceae bacterium]
MSTHPKWLERAGVLAGVLVLVIAFAVPAVAGASSAGSEAATWLGKQLKPEPTSNPAYCEEFVKGGPSVAETLECSLAFKAAAMTSKSNATYKYAMEHFNEYIGTKSCSEGEAMRAGSVAKFALVAEAKEHNPQSVGGRNLIADLKCLQLASGRFDDKGETEDFSNTFTQSLAIIALKGCEAGDCPGSPNLKAWIEPAGKYLREQQCESTSVLLNGAFRSTLGLKSTECNANPPFTETEPENKNAVEVDSTGVAVQALLAEGSVASKTTATKALTWLKENSEHSAGPPATRVWKSYCSETEFTKLLPSVNSTSLASMAYIEAGKPIEEPQAWLTGIVEKQPKSEKGLPACTASGSPNVFATAQGILALEGVSYPGLVGL